MDSLVDARAPKVIEEKFFSGVSDPLEVIFNMNSIDERSLAQALQIEKDVSLGDIIER